MHVFTYLFQYSKWTLYGSFLFSIMGGITSTGLLVLVNESITPPAPFQYPIPLFGLLLLGYGITNFFAHFLLVRLSQQLVYFLRVSFCEFIAYAPLTVLESIGASQLMVCLTTDLEKIALTVRKLPVFLLNVMITLCCMIYLALLSWPLLVMCAGIIATCMIGYSIPIRSAQGLFKLIRKGEDEFITFFKYLVYGHTEFHMNHPRYQHFFSRILDPLFQVQQSRTVRGRLLVSALSLVGEMGLFLCLGSLLFIIPFFNGMPHALLTQFLLVLVFALTPLKMVWNYQSIFEETRVALDRVQAILSPTPSPSSLSQSQTPIDLFKAPFTLKISDLTFSYSDHHFQMGPISATFRPGEIICVTGGNGSGKSTFGRLIAGLYSPLGGTIALSTIHVTPDLLTAYRHCISYTHPDAMLVPYHLLQSNDHSRLRKLQNYLNLFEINDCITIQDYYLAAPPLSSGQQKRLSLILHLMEERPILILDEWAAHQDARFKDMFYTSILPSLKKENRCIIVISHDEACHTVADQHLIFKNGQLHANAIETYAPLSPSTLSKG